MRLARLGIAVAVALCALAAAAPIAGADPARPGNYSSEVLRVTPPTDAIKVKVVGGDGFLDLRVRPGHTVAIPGYTGEPWLRVDARGVVQENMASSATYLNETRYGSEANTQIPNWITIKGATEHPQWKTVSHGGHYAWHDHRIHYMNPSVAPTLVPGTNRVVISDRADGLWYIPITVDGNAHTIFGELLVFPAPSPAPQWALAGVIFVLLSAAGLFLHGPASRIAAGALVVAGGLALWAGASELSVIPALAGGNPIWVALPAVCVGLGVVALVTRSATTRAIVVLAAAAALGVWAVLRVPALDTAVPLGALNSTLTRFIIAAALGTAAGSIVAAITSGGLALRLTGLDDEVPEDGGSTPEPAPNLEPTPKP